MAQLTENALVLEPLRRAFPAEKSKAWHYKIHPYYTKQPSNVVAEYIKHFCPPGGLVLDPFCGSGVTAIEALTNRRRAIAIDLDPLAVFITRMTCLAPVDLNVYWEAYRQVEKELAPIVDFVRRASPQELEAYELKEWYPKGVKLPSNADRGHVEDLFSRGNLILLSHLRAAIGRITLQQARELLLFTFSGALPMASLCCMEAGWGSRIGIFSVYRYWVGPKPWHRNAWDVFAGRAHLVTRAKEKSHQLLKDFYEEGDTFSIYQDSAENLLKYVKGNSVDYIYTDPPYGAHIAYLDLGTMWHAWLGMEVTPEMKAREAIENGEMGFDEAHYLDVLQKSFEAMFKALKDGAWLSLVFHHKETRLWYSIRDMLKYIGFEYVNCVAQPVRPGTAKQTLHKTKNPLRVLGESLIINLKKTRQRKIMEPLPLPLVNIVKNAAERAIVRGGGATTEEILREVVPELFEANLFLDAASKNLGDILAILESDFELGEDNLWHLKRGHKLGGFIPVRDRLRYYVVAYLRKVGKAKFDDIVTTLLPLLINGHRPSKEEISDVLTEIAISFNGVDWELKPVGELAKQGVMPLFEERAEYEIPQGTIHNQHIYRLALLAQKAGLSFYIGKRERGDPLFAGLRPLTYLNLKADEAKRRRIEEIDLIWAMADGSPLWAFEVEESTPILSALERFTALLDVVPELGHERRLTIIAPKSRRRKLNQELTTSSYIGRPQFMENKLSYFFREDLEANFNKFSAQANFSIETMHSLCYPAGVAQGGG